MQRPTLLIVATAVGLAAATAYVTTRPQEAGMRRLEVARLMTAPTDQIDRVELTGEHNVLLRREKQTWLLGNGRAADPRLAADVVDRLTHLSSSDFVTDDAARAKALGLGEAQAIDVRAFAAGERKLHLTLLPRPEAIDVGSVAGLVATDAGEVFGEQVGLHQLMQRSESAFEDREVLATAMVDVRVVEVALAGEQAYALAQADGGWQLQPPASGAGAANVVAAMAAPGATGAPAAAGTPKVATAQPLPAIRFDPQQAQGLVLRLSSLRASDLVDQDPGEAVTGLTANAGDFWRYTTADAGTGWLQVGNPNAGGGRWAKVSHRPLPFLLDDNSVEGLRQKVGDMADLRLMAPVDFDNLTELVLRPKPKQTVHLRKRGETWIARRADGLAKGFAPAPAPIKQRMRQATLARALAVVPAAERAKAKASFAPSQVKTLTLVQADGSRHVLTVGGPTTLRGTPAFYAQGTADAEIYVVSRPLVDNLLGKLAELGKAAATAKAGGSVPQGLDSLPPEVQESIRKQLAAGATKP